MSDPIYKFVATNPFGLTDAGSLASPAFVDIDNDGDLDAFVGNSAGDTLFFRNTGTVSNPAFAAATTNPFGLVDVGYQADPTFVDIDGDGDLDAFVGNYHGNTLFFKNTGTVNDPAFAAPKTNPFGLIDVGGYASPTFVDIDGDGDLDAFVGWGHYFGSGSTLFFRNTGTVNNPSFAAAVANPFGLSDAGGYTHPAFVNIDGDSDLDVFVGNNDGDMLFFKNAGIGSSPSFSTGRKFGLTDVGINPDPTFVDIDGDGDLDAFVGTGYEYYFDAGGDILFFENTGTTRSPAFGARETNPFGLNNVGIFASPAFVDIDNDGDLDAFVGNSVGDTLFFENTGTASNPAFAAATTNPFGLVGVGMSARPTFVDIDDDGDLDAFINNKFFENTGTANAPAFGAPETNPFGLSGLSPTFADIDRDGDLDAFVGTDGAQFFKNTGTASNPAFSFGGDNPFGLPKSVGRSTVTSLTFVDIDGDGDLDAYVTENYIYAGVYASQSFLINNNAPNVANLNAPETYAKNISKNLTDIIISDVDSENVTAILTLSNTSAGKLNTATSGAVTSVYNAGTGVWKASGALADVNALLAGLTFTPAPDFNQAFRINTSISDDVAQPLLGSKSFTTNTGVLLKSTPGDDILTGTSSDNDTVTYASATAAVTVSLLKTTQQNTIGAGRDTLTKIENLIGSKFNDTLIGDAKHNVLDGRGGNDTLKGWSGADTMIGRWGHDTYFVENVGDVVIEKPNQGKDTVSSKITYTLPANVENLVLTGTRAIDGTGNGQANMITGNKAANELNGKGGNDTLDGKGGNDTLNGGSGADTMIGRWGHDTYFVENVGDVVIEKPNQGKDTVSSKITYTLPANVENLILTGTRAIDGAGNGQANIIMGNKAANELNGKRGNDTLDGKAGNNVLTGGAGKDIFQFTTKGHVNTITDFNVLNDTIELDNAVFTALTATGTLAASQFRTGWKALDANDFIIYNSVKGKLLYDADGNGDIAAIPIATVGVGLAMTHADIVVI